MNLFDVYPRFNVTPSHAKGAFIYDVKGKEYLDLYGGHGVISVGHCHPVYVENLTKQLHKIGFYSNSVEMPIQETLAKKLGKVSGYDDYNLFLCNSGAEANENALKLASFHTGKKKIIAFKKSFHGRTGAALNVTDNIKLSAPINRGNFPVAFLDLNDASQLAMALANDDVAAVIVEGIQGVGGLDYPHDSFLKFVSEACKAHGALLILDEIQSGFGRSGKFFAHQYAEIEPDLITMAKGMGNGFPVAGVLVDPNIEAFYGQLGTTFGGNHLACAAALSVLEIIEDEQLMKKVNVTSKFLVDALSNIEKIKHIKGRGLMLGLEFDFPIKNLRLTLLEQYHLFTGASSNPNLLRILPPLSITEQALLPFINALKTELL